MTLSENVWAELALAPTTDPRAIKRAYATRLRDTRPDTDPEGFQRLRAAYETALAMLEHAAVGPLQAAPPRQRAAPRVMPPASAAAPVAAPVDTPARPALEQEFEPEMMASALCRQASHAPGSAIAALDELLAGDRLLSLEQRRRFEATLVNELAGSSPPDMTFHAAVAERLRWEPQRMAAAQLQQGIDEILARLEARRTLGALRALAKDKDQRGWAARELLRKDRIRVRWFPRHSLAHLRAMGLVLHELLARGSAVFHFELEQARAQVWFERVRRPAVLLDDVAAVIAVPLTVGPIAAALPFAYAPGAASYLGDIGLWQAVALATALVASVTLMVFRRTRAVPDSVLWFPRRIPWQPGPGAAVWLLFVMGGLGVNLYERLHLPPATPGIVIAAIVYAALCACVFNQLAGAAARVVLAAVGYVVARLRQYRTSHPMVTVAFDLAMASMLLTPAVLAGFTSHDLGPAWWLLPAAVTYFMGLHGLLWSALIAAACATVAAEFARHGLLPGIEHGPGLAAYGALLVALPLSWFAPRVRLLRWLYRTGPALALAALLTCIGIGWVGNLGKAYLARHGLAYSVEHVHDLRSAYAGDAAAQYRVATVYREAGGRTNASKARLWYELAALHGHAGAARFLADLGRPKQVSMRATPSPPKRAAPSASALDTRAARASLLQESARARFEMELFPMPESGQQ